MKHSSISPQNNFALACRLFANIDDPDHVSKLKDELEVVVSGVLQVPVKLPGTRYYKAMKAAETIRKELAAVIKQRRVDLMEKNIVSSAQDLLSYLLVTGDDDGQFMTEGEIIDNILLLLFAGHDTTSCAMTLVVKNLGELPHIYNEVFRGMYLSFLSL